MLCDKILGNLGDPWPDDIGERDLVDIRWDECGKRALRKRSRGGKQVNTLLPRGVRLRHGDVLFDNAAERLIVNLLPCEVLVLRPPSLRDMGVLALELGNLHAPVEISGNLIIVLPDGPIEALFARHGISYEKQVRRFMPLPVEVSPHLRLAEEFRIAPANR